MNYTSVLQCQMCRSFASRACELGQIWHGATAVTLLKLSIVHCCRAADRNHFGFLVAVWEHRPVRHMWPEVNKSGGLKVCVCVCNEMSVGIIYGFVYL